ncbi:MAG: hypothetical protein KGJ59_12640 [Bacteroidota bacterium]|nr:hypothetical protein [Bacteroidota bacterium]
MSEKYSQKVRKMRITSFPNVLIGNPATRVPAFAGMTFRWLYCSIAFALLITVIAGCSGKKADPVQIHKANEALARGEFETGIALLDSLAQESPDDDALKSARAAAHMKYADYLMYDSPLPPHQKYPGALRQYRIVVSLDPTNQEAKQDIDMIESIYRQMGKPIPQ